MNIGMMPGGNAPNEMFLMMFLMMMMGNGAMFGDNMMFLLIMLMTMSGPMAPGMPGMHAPKLY